VEEELKIIKQVDEFLKAVKCDGLKLLTVIYFANRHSSWICALDVLPYGVTDPSFYALAIKLEKYGLVRRRRLDVMTFLRITDKGMKLVEMLIEMSKEPQQAPQSQAVDQNKEPPETQGGAQS